MPTTFVNQIDNLDIYAKRAECDAAGNTIATTYATKSELPDGVPAVTSSDDSKVLKASYSGGVGSYSWQTEQGGGSTYTAGDGIDITSDVISADVDGTTIGIDSSTKKIKLLSTIPSVDQTYSAASTNAQSGTAVAGAIATKEDAFDVGTGLEMDTSGVTPTLQVEAPVDIVAGPGIVIDNPDGNTLRVSVAHLDDWEDVSSEITKSTTIITGGSITFRYNKAMKMISMIGEIHVQGAGDVYTLPEKYRPQTNFTCANPGATSYIDYTPSNGKFVARSGANGYFSWTMTMPCLGE